MSSIEKIRVYLNEHGSGKATDIARSLGCPRKAVNSTLYYNKDVFKKNLFNQWELIDTTDNLPGQAVQEGLVKEYRPERSIFVENIDLVERITELLKKHSSLSVRTIADHLDEQRSIVTRRLHSFQSIFEKTADNEWRTKSDYVSNGTGENADSTTLSEPEEAELIPRAKLDENYNPSQKVVIEASLDRSFLVLASPGTGKTYTLVERLVYAITNSVKKVNAGEFLVLSFTRAAVGEIRERIACAIANGAPTSLRYVQVKTFDAYATWLLNDGGYDVADKTYDSRILLLTKELKNVSLRQLTARIDRSRYLFVDEIQDLVGVRADMVFELIKRILSSKGSVTLLGDPHQSLNEYQIRAAQTNSSEFLAEVNSFLTENLECFELEESHRFETPEMKSLAANAKAILDNGQLAAKDKINLLVELIPEITQEQLIKSFKNGSIDALLCRSNAEVFQWINWLEGQGNTCTVNAGAIGRPWPAWLGRAIMHYQSAVMTREQLLNRLSSNMGDGLAPTEEELDGFLLSERLVRRNIINLEELAFRLKYLSPAKKGDEADNGLVVSTVHKAKGLEYKNVVVIQPSQKNITDEEVRVLYVAITRAKSSITLLPISKIPFNGYRKKGHGGHYRFTKDEVKFNQILGLEDFDLETLFITAESGVDDASLVKYLSSCSAVSNFIIQSSDKVNDLDHHYALYMLAPSEKIRICSVSEALRKDINAMSLTKENGEWKPLYGELGAKIDCENICNYQTIVHPMQSSILARHIGPSGIMVFPIIQGFYPLSRATGD